MCPNGQKGSNDEKGKDVKRGNPRLWFIVGIIVIFTLYLLMFIPFFLNEPSSSSQTVILIFGVVALIFSLTFMVVVYNDLNLTSPSNTLGLPEGSVRAVIALSLILIFMISSLFLYSQIEQGNANVYEYKGITQKQIDNITNAQIVSITRLNQTNENNETLFDVVTLVNKTSTAGTDIAKQIITTVSTLVVAVAGFYFGAKAGESKTVEQKVEGKSIPVISKISTNPKELFTEEEREIEVTIEGKNFEKPKVELRKKDAKTIIITDPPSNSNQILCKVTLKTDTPKGKWTVVVVNSDKGEHVLEDAIEIK